MSFPGPARPSDLSPPGGCSIPLGGGPSAALTLDFHIPILARSATLLRVLLQDSIVDLNLAGAVITLDPGLAYRVLQLANRDLPDDRDRIWQLPLAIVTAGRTNILELLEQSAQVDGDGSCPRLPQLVMDAVLRACLAFSLARELASSSPRKCFLSGLLFDLPTLVALSVPQRLDMHATLLSDMCHSLPVTIVRATLAQSAYREGSSDPTVAIVLIARQLLRALQAETSQSRLQEAAGDPLWRPWQAIPELQRLKISQRCCELARWAGQNLYRLHPWEFMAQLEDA